MNRTGRILARLALGLGVLAGLAIVLLLLLSYLVDTDRLRTRIVDELSMRVNGTVKVRSIGLYFLPRLRLIMHQAEISVPGAADIHAESVTAYPRILPLFRGRVRLSRIRIETPLVSAAIPKFEAVERTGGFTLSGLREDLKRFLDSLAERAFGLTVEVERGKVRIVTEGTTDVLFEEVHGRIVFPPGIVAVRITASSGTGEAFHLDGSLDPEDLSLEGRLRLKRFKPDTWADHFHLSLPVETRDALLELDADFRSEGTGVLLATIRNLVLESPRLPGPLSMTEGRLEATGETVSLRNWKTVFMDAALRVSGRLQNYLQGAARVEAEIAGTSGPEATQWVLAFVPTPLEVKPDLRLDIKGVRIAWEKEVETLVSGDISPENGPAISVDLRSAPGVLTVKNLHVADRDSDLAMTVDLQQRNLEMSFKGRLTRTTLTRILAEDLFLDGFLEGDLQTRISLDEPSSSDARGELKVVGLRNPWERNIPVRLESALLRAEGSRLTVDKAEFAWGKEKRASLSGEMNFSEEGLLLNMDLVADGVEQEELEAVREAWAEGGEEPGGEKGFLMDFPLRGEIRIMPEYLRYRGFTWKPLTARVVFFDKRIQIRTEDARFCSILTPVTAAWTPDGVEIHSKLIAGGAPLSDVLECLWERGDLMTGVFSVDGDITAAADPGRLAEALRGSIQFTAADGRIYRFDLLARILAVINITEILRGEIPDLTGEGLAFDAIVGRFNVKGGVLDVEEVILEGTSVDLFCIGSLDLRQRTMDLTVTVAPLRTVDAIIGRIPLVGKILGGTLISIPARVRGDFDNPTVIPISPAEVGARMLGIMERTLKLPFRLLEPFSSNG